MQLTATLQLTTTHNSLCVCAEIDPQRRAQLEFEADFREHQDWAMNINDKLPSGLLLDYLDRKLKTTNPSMTKTGAKVPNECYDYESVVGTGPVGS